MREDGYGLSAGALLRELGLSPRRKGYVYLAWAASLTAEEIAQRGALPEHLCRKVAQHCGATPAAVERTMRNAIAEIWRAGDPAVRKALFPRGTVSGRNIPPTAVFVRISAQTILLNWDRES